jgi:transcriptional regulator with XRE-family HTH domain
LEEPVRRKDLMGTGKRIKPERLAEKLKAIRVNLGLTTEELIIKLECPEVPLHRASITQYEKGRREPNLIVLLHYARLVRLTVDSLIDDEIDLLL